MAGPLRVAFQGELGAFGDEAIQQLWGGGAERVPCRDFGAVVAALANGLVDRAVLPVENSIAGPVLAARAALDAEPRVRQIDETHVAVHLCLLGVAGATLTSVRQAFSHPVALAQCELFFRTHSYVTPYPAYDTAGAARDVASRANPECAAVANRASAALYGLEILADRIEDHANNSTRFVALARADTETGA